MKIQEVQGIHNGTRNMRRKDKLVGMCVIVYAIYT